MLGYLRRIIGIGVGSGSSGTWGVGNASTLLFAVFPYHLSPTLDFLVYFVLQLFIKFFLLLSVQRDLLNLVDQPYHAVRLRIFQRFQAVSGRLATTRGSSSAFNNA